LHVWEGKRGGDGLRADAGDTAVETNQKMEDKILPHINLLISELAYDVGLVDEEEYNNLLWDLSGTIHL
jgi:hypothetical protein